MYTFNLKGIFLILTILALQLHPILAMRAQASMPVPASSPALAPASLPVSEEKDIRVVIDMSGSMKKNDPHNHRTKAVQLFSEILPTDVISGIWTFASEVNMLVKHEKVSKAWKGTAFKKATKIHSYGMYTNIEKAIRVSTKNLHNKEVTRERHVILLTDGYIDIAKDPEINNASRQRVVNELIPGLRKSHIIVHSIALSDQADHKLLKLLSNKTGGRYAVIKKADDLDRYFFKLFQSTAKPDTVPLKSNQFDIDKSINDMTVVLFNSNNPTELITPEKEKWTHSKHPKSVKWVKSDNYEIITVSKPAVGSWYIDAPIDPDNKIMIVTNLKLKVAKLPSILLPGESLDINATLTEKDIVIKKEEFIKLVNIRAILKKTGSLQRKLTDAPYQGEGVFSAKVKIDTIEDTGTLLLTAKSPTFEREYRHDFTVISNPVLVDTKLNDSNKITLTAYVDDRALDADHIELLLDDGHNRKALGRLGNKWELQLPGDYAGKQVSILVDAQLQNGKPYNVPVLASLPEIETKTDKQHEEHTAPVKEPEEVKQVLEKVEEPVKETNKEQNKPEPAVVEEENSSLNWILVFISVLLINGILIIGGYFIYKKYFKSNDDDDFLSLDESEVSNDDEPADSDDNDEIEDLDDLDDMSEIESSKDSS